MAADAAQIMAERSKDGRLLCGSCRDEARAATLQECLWVAKNALGQVEKGAPSAYWRGIAEEALALIAEMEGPDA